MSWEWKSDLRLTDDKSDGWTPYDAAVSAKIEKAYQKGQKTMTLDETYKIDFTELFQHRKEVRKTCHDFLRSSTVFQYTMEA
jgi:uncharacterized protein YktA (UPF0223 family)